MSYSFEQETGLYILDEIETVAADGKTLVVDMVIFIPVTLDGDDLILKDIDDNVFVEMKGAKNKPNIYPFPKPRKLNGLKVTAIDSGKAYVYLAQS